MLTRVRSGAGAMAVAQVAGAMFVVMAILPASVSFAAAADVRMASIWRIEFPVEDEPGEPMVVHGTLYAADGKTPIPGATLYAYHTDIRGYYGEDSRGAENPRLRGTLTTSPDGRYEFRTIRPGPYPSGGVPAHVHYVVTVAGREHGFELIFEGDPLVSDRMKQRAAAGDFFVLRPADKDEDGVWRVEADLVLPERD